jgi:hypothetical protein
MTPGLRCETFSKNTIWFFFSSPDQWWKSLFIRRGGLRTPTTITAITSMPPRVMAARPNQTKQNGRNQRRESHPLAIKSMPLSLSLWQLVQTKPNKMAEIRREYPIPLPLQDCLSLVRAASPNQTKRNSGNQTRVSHPFAIARMPLSR